MNQTLETDQADTIDARPEFRSSPDAAWLRAYSVRQKFVDGIEAELVGHGIRALTTKSLNGVYPPWLRVEAWLPNSSWQSEDSDPRMRCNMQIILDTRPYHEHEIVTSVSANNGKKSISVTDRVNFDESDAREWATFMVQKGPLPSDYRPWMDTIAGIVLPFIPFAQTRHTNKISATYRNARWMVSLALFVVLGIVVLSIATVNPDAAIFVGFLLLAAYLVALARRQKSISVIATPDKSPRALLPVDSWQTVIPQLGERLLDMKGRILKALNKREADGLVIEEETYGFTTPGGYEERDRIIVSKGQGVAQIHIYQFGTDIYVGWESFVNWAKWGETKAVSAKSNFSSVVEFRAVKEALYIPNEFDLIDLNSLSEVVHRDTTSVIKTMMKEFEIDQEIDFQIIRGDREGALDKERFDKRTKSERPTKSRRWSIR